MIAILSPLSVKVPKDTIPDAVTFTRPVALPEAILATPSVNVPADTCPEKVPAVIPDNVASRFTVNVLLEPAVVMLVSIAKVTSSPELLDVMFNPPNSFNLSEPNATTLSAASSDWIVNEVDIAAVPAAVILPC